MKKTIGQTIIKIMSIIFSIFFVVILFNTIFFNRMITIDFNIPLMIIGTIVIYFALFGLYYIYNKKNWKFLEYKPKKSEILCVLLIIFIVQYIVAKLLYAYIGWDCGEVIKSAFTLLQGEKCNIMYYMQYPNNVGMLLLMKYVFVIAKQFTDMTVISNAFFVAIIFNIIIVDLAALFTFLTIKKVLGIKKAYFSLIFILPLIVFSPYIVIPYTDTLTMIFPIMTLCLYLTIKELPEESIKKYLLILLLGIELIFGINLKPTVVIMPIAIFIIEILNINKETMKSFKENVLKKIFYAVLILLIFSLGCATTYFGYNKLKNKNLGKYISKEDSELYSIPFSHFLMMGMQTRLNDTKEAGKNQILYGAYSGNDVINTTSVNGYKEKQKYNIEIVRERLKNFGCLGYLSFLYNKANWILSDGTFFYGHEGHWIVNDYYNKTDLAIELQKFINVEDDMYINVTANIMQILWILITLGLVLSYSKNSDKYVDVGKLAIIGIVLFILLFEGRSRYLLNHLPVFLFIGTYGLTDSFNKLTKIFEKLVLTLKLK